MKVHCTVVGEDQMIGYGVKSADSKRANARGLPFDHELVRLHLGLWPCYLLLVTNSEGCNRPLSLVVVLLCDLQSHVSINMTATKSYPFRSVVELTAPLFIFKLNRVVGACEIARRLQDTAASPEAVEYPRHV